MKEGMIDNNINVSRTGFYTTLNNSLPMGEKSTLVQENIELCEKKVLELKSCNDGSTHSLVATSVISNNNH